MKKMIPNILSIAGSDPSGGAGVQADLKTFTTLGCYGMAAITALTAQNTQGVRSVVNVPERFMRDQLDAIFEDITVDAVKIGMLSSVEIMNVVADSLEKYQVQNVVLDPVMVASSGDVLMEADAIDVLKNRLIPMATLITPNIAEAEKLMRKSVLDFEESAKSLLDLGAQAVLLKGGHTKGDVARDILADKDGVSTFEAPRIYTMNTHGTGCTLSSAIAAYLGQEEPLKEACAKAKSYLTKALDHSFELDIGQGSGPVNHIWNLHD